jgi:hypothetical protein
LLSSLKLDSKLPCKAATADDEQHAKSHKLPQVVFQLVPCSTLQQLISPSRCVMLHTM